MDRAACERLRDCLGAEGENVIWPTKVSAKLPGDEAFDINFV